MRFLGRSLIGVLLIALTAGLLAFAGQLVWGALEERRADTPEARPARERVFAARVISVEADTIRPVLSTFGEVRARRSLELRAAAAGEVVWLSEAFEEGGLVVAGDTLLRIDPASAQSALDTARADLSEAEADLRDADRSLILAAADLKSAEDQALLRERALERQLDLLERGVGSQAAVEVAELAASSAEQAIVSRQISEASAEARLDQAKTMLERRQIAFRDTERRLADTELKAAFGGVLSDIDVVQGGLVSANERLADLVDPTDLEVAFPVSTAQYARLLNAGGELVGAEIEARIDVLGLELVAKGAISRVSAVVADGQTGRLLFARLERAPGFRPGDFVSVRIEEPALTGVARLPSTAVGADGSVLAVGSEERLEVLASELLRREGDDVIVDASGIAGREIVAERTPLLGAGIRVRPIRPDSAVAAASAPETVSLDPERRARLITFVEGNDSMPAEVKERMLTQLRRDAVPARVVDRLESRMGG